MNKSSRVTLSHPFSEYFELDRLNCKKYVKIQNKLTFFFLYFNNLDMQTYLPERIFKNLNSFQS